MLKLLSKLKNLFRQESSSCKNIRQSLAEDNLQKVLDLESIGETDSERYHKACREALYYGSHLSVSDYDRFNETEYCKELMAFGRRTMKD